MILKIKYVAFLSIVLTIVSGALGYEIGDSGSNEKVTNMVLHVTSMNLGGSTVALATLKRNRPGCTKWLLEVQVSSVTKNWRDFESSPYASRAGLSELKDAIDRANEVLEAPDSSGTISNGCEGLEQSK